MESDSFLKIYPIPKSIFFFTNYRNVIMNRILNHIITHAQKFLEKLKLSKQEKIRISSVRAGFFVNHNVLLTVFFKNLTRMKIIILGITS